MSKSGFYGLGPLFRGGTFDQDQELSAGAPVYRVLPRILFAARTRLQLRGRRRVRINN